MSPQLGHMSGLLDGSNNIRGWDRCGRDTVSDTGALGPRRDGHPVDNEGGLLHQGVAGYGSRVDIPFASHDGRRNEGNKRCKSKDSRAELHGEVTGWQLKLGNSQCSFRYITDPPSLLIHNPVSAFEVWHMACEVRTGVASYQNSSRTGSVRS